MYACSIPPSGQHTDYTMTVPEAHPHLKYPTYLPALLNPERDAYYNLSKRRELLSLQNSVHILQDLNPAQYLLYIL